MRARSAMVILGLLGCGRVAFDPTATVADGSVLTVDALPACNVAMPGLVQSRCDFMTAATASATFPSSITAGNLLVVAVNYDSTTANPTVTDTAGHAMQPGVLARGGSATSMLFFASITNGGPDTVTVTLDGPAGFTAVFAHELTGVGAVDGWTSEFGMGTIATTQPLSISFANALLFGHAVSNNIVETVETEFSPIQSCAGDMTAFTVAAAPGEYAASYTLATNTGWQATLTAFRPCI